MLSYEQLLLLKDSSFTSANSDTPPTTTLGLSRLHYPDSCIIVGFSLEYPRNAVHITRQRRGFPFPSTALFPRPTPSSHPLQITAPHSKLCLTTAVHGTNLGPRTILPMLCISYSPSHARARTTLWVGWTFCLIHRCWYRILSTLHNSPFLPPRPNTTF